jgi:diguanylate cyclase (GGDEF)-like protein
MSLFQIATAAHLAGSLVLALFFVLIARHDPRAYLRQWTAEWIAQVLALGALLVASFQVPRLGFGIYLLFEAAHGLLLNAAALNFARGWVIAWRHAALLVPFVAWGVLGPRLAYHSWTLYAVEFFVLSILYLTACVILWPLREPAGMGLRLTTNILGLLGVLHLFRGGLFAWAVRNGIGSEALVEIAPFSVLFLQMMLGLSMVLAVMEATQWALSTTNAQLTEAERRLKTLAETDPLTGCYNRRVFRELVDELRGEGRSPEGIVLMLDMDGLKALNDREGHAAGDDAIRSVAEAIHSRTRTTDVVVRWGGDEFVVVIPGASRAEGEGRRAQIVAAIAEAGLSASAGLAAYEVGKDIMLAVQEADSAMYRVKSERPGRVAGA